jgi:hypothetical protein
VLSLVPCVAILVGCVLLTGLGVEMTGSSRRMLEARLPASEASKRHRIEITETECSFESFVAYDAVLLEYVVSSDDCSWSTRRTSAGIEVLSIQFRAKGSDALFVSVEFIVVRNNETVELTTAGSPDLLGPVVFARPQ